MKPLEVADALWQYASTTQRLYHYFGILTMFGAAELGVYTKNERTLKTVVEMLERYPKDFHTPELYFSRNFVNYEVGGIAKSWLFMKGYFAHQADVIRDYCEKTLSSPRSADGVICGPRDLENCPIWIDIVYAVAPYMLHTGLKLGEERYVDFACDQTFRMFEIFLDRENGLLHQCRGFMADKKQISEDHWSRGNGWGYIGLTELMKYLPKDHRHYERARKYYTDLSAALIRYQDEKGLWRQELPLEWSWEESSGTALFLYGIGTGIRLGILDRGTYMPVFEKGILGLKKYCVNDDFSVTHCCQGCLAPGYNEETRGHVIGYIRDVLPQKDDGHAFGPFILAFLEAERLGMQDVG